MSGGKRFTNRLARETSPYLLQHKHNPVDWHAWGDDAFELARKLDRPIFLSVGYSTCYWCHVMERQCFENESIAAVMNELFVNIKVDREERPDVDQLYMIAVQLLTHSGGWPMSVWLTPELKPFFAGTYFPPTDQYGRPGFPRLLKALSEAWRNRRDEVTEQSARITVALERFSSVSPARENRVIDNDTVAALVMRSVGDFDAQLGGFGRAPKFPRQTLLDMLLSVRDADGIDTASVDSMLRTTLDAMMYGGIRDQLGGAFHRYSTDGKWLVPHFEIMLYDNAMLASIYSRASVALNDARYARVAREVCDFVLDRLAASNGAFFTAIDAEVDAKEGESYLWTKEQVVKAIGDDDAQLFCDIFGVSEGPNFADPHHGDGNPDSNVLYVRDRERFERESAHLTTLRTRLLQARNRRKQPITDTKILTSWNALMISALVDCADVLRNESYRNAAMRCADYLIAHHVRDRRVMRSSLDGTVKHAGCVDDYAFLIHALLRLSATKRHYADVARQLLDSVDEQFASPERAFYFSPADAQDIIVRQVTASDSPLPSGNAVMIQNLLALDRKSQAQACLIALAKSLDDNVESMSAMVTAAARVVDRCGPVTIVAAADMEDEARLSPESVLRAPIELSAVWGDPRTLVIEANIGDGWHINSNVTSENLVPTEVLIAREVAELVHHVQYPESVSIGAGAGLIEVYEGACRFILHFHRAMVAGDSVRVAIRYQPCNDSACLAPTTHPVSVPQPPQD